MNKLVVCCDGSWNENDKTIDGRVAPTNVYRLFNAVDKKDPSQKSYYHPGVGTEGDIFNFLLGGTFGKGLDKNIMSAYHWLAETYVEGDSIFLFGFSRGAYTVRSLAGMICHCGLLDLNGVNSDVGQKQVDRVYKEGYRRQRNRSEWDSDLQFHMSPKPLTFPIHFLGVWDTVGTLGIPDDLALINEFDRKDYLFHNTDLHPNIQHARHAVALDEMRASFSPTLWSKIPTECDALELWFPGVHCDVGGGDYSETGLADGALKWMIDEATNNGLSFTPAMLSQIKPNYQDVLHDSLVVIFKSLHPQPRAIPLITDTKKMHSSVIARYEDPPIMQASFHPTKIVNREEGINHNHFLLSEIAQVIGSTIGQMEKVYQKATGNNQADFKTSKRFEDANWFALIGLVANQRGVNPDGTPDSHQPFVIGKNHHLPVTEPGYLYCYANDAWDFYLNNRGNVQLKVCRI